MAFDRLAALYDKSEQLRESSSLGNLASPPINGTAIGGNPLNDWAVSSSMADSQSAGRKKSYRANALITNDLFGVAHSQTSIGFDREYSDGAAVAYNYYLAGSDGTVAIDPSKSNLGRTQIPTQWWAVDNGPIEYPLPKVGAKSMTAINPATGQPALWVRMPTNPRSPAWVTPNNPLGLASLYEASISATGTNTNGVSGTNGGPFTSQTRYQGYYLANYTAWWDDLFETLIGARESDAFTRNPNTTAGVNRAYTETRTGSLPSYNAGVVFKLPYLTWLRGYYEYSRTFDIPAGGNDPLGNQPANPTGYTHEGGLKFTVHNGDSVVSGDLLRSLAYSDQPLQWRQHVPGHGERSRPERRVLSGRRAPAAPGRATTRPRAGSTTM